MAISIRFRPFIVPLSLASLGVVTALAACVQESKRAVTDGSGQSSQVVGFADAPAAPPIASVGRSRVEGQTAKDASAEGGGVTGTLAANAITVGPTTSAQIGETVAPNMIVRTGQASVEVTSLDTAVARVRGVANALGGYIANVNLQSGSQQVRSATLEIKVPSARFDQAVTGLSAIGKVESVNVNAEDVGEEFTDISARVSNARRLEERLITLLATRTGKLQEVLSVERELARVREEIERYEGRLRYLRSRAAISTLSVMVHEPSPLLGPPPGRNVIVEAFKDAWRHFVGFVAGLIESLGVLVPLALILGAIWIGLRRWQPRVITRGVPVRTIEKETPVEEEAAPRT